MGLVYQDLYCLHTLKYGLSLLRLLLHYWSFNWSVVSHTDEDWIARNKFAWGLESIHLYICEVMEYLLWSPSPVCVENVRMKMNNVGPITLQLGTKCMNISVFVLADVTMLEFTERLGSIKSSPNQLEAFKFLRIIRETLQTMDWRLFDRVCWMAR